jgi:hypothetical protein
VKDQWVQLGLPEQTGRTQMQPVPNATILPELILLVHSLRIQNMLMEMQILKKSEALAALHAMNQKLLNMLLQIMYRQSSQLFRQLLPTQIRMQHLQAHLMDQCSAICVTSICIHPILLLILCL